MEEQIDKILNLAVQFGMNLLAAVAVYFIGVYVIKILMNILHKALKKNKRVDQTLQQYIGTIAKTVLYVILIVSIIGILGVETSSFAALIAAAGLAIGLSLQGSLGNIAGGFLIILFKPFKVGDFIEAQGHKGEVNDIQLFATILKTVDNKTVILPNGALAGDAIVNYSTEKHRRCDIVLGISYNDDIDKARDIVSKLIEEDGRYLKDLGYEILVSELADSSVNLSVRTWVENDDFWPFSFKLREDSKKAFDREGISIPFPQRDIHLIKED